MRFVRYRNFLSQSRFFAISCHNFGLVAAGNRKTLGKIKVFFLNKLTTLCARGRVHQKMRPYISSSLHFFESGKMDGEKYQRAKIQPSNSRLKPGNATPRAPEIRCQVLLIRLSLWSTKSISPESKHINPEIITVMLSPDSIWNTCHFDPFMAQFSESLNKKPLILRAKLLNIFRKYVV